MILRLVIAIVFILLTGCRSVPEPEPDPQPIEQPQPDPDPDPVAQPEPDEPPPPAPAGPVKATLSLGEEVVLVDGFRATWAGRNHKHGKGYTLGIWKVELSDGEAVEEHEFRSRGDVWAEGRSFGYVWMIRGDHDRLRVIIAPPAFEALTEDQARESLRERFIKAGMTECPLSGSSVESGVLSMTCRVGEEVVAEGSIGLHTKSVTALVPARDTSDPDL